jgi:hypothetical protein
MVHSGWFWGLLNILIIVSCISFFSGWAILSAQTAVLEQKQELEQPVEELKAAFEMQTQAEEKQGVQQTVIERQAGAPKPYLPQQRANIPLD